MAIFNHEIDNKSSHLRVLLTFGGSMTIFDHADRKMLLAEIVETCFSFFSSFLSSPLSYL